MWIKFIQPVLHIWSFFFFSGFWKDMKGMPPMWKIFDEGKTFMPLSWYASFRLRTWEMSRVAQWKKGKPLPQATSTPIRSVGFFFCKCTVSFFLCKCITSWTNLQTSLSNFFNLFFCGLRTSLTEQAWTYLISRKITISAKEVKSEDN